MLSQTAVSRKWPVVSNPPQATVPDTLAALFRGQVEERFDTGTAMFWEGDPARDVFEVVAGVLRIYRILGDGRRVITGFLYPGDLVGVSLRDRYLYTAEAVTPMKVRRFSRRRFDDEMVRFPELRPQLFARVCDEMAAAQDQMVLLARKTAEERVCSFLLDVARRVEVDRADLPVIDIPMTRLDMADYLGLTIETVSRTMSKLMRAKIIAAEGRHALLIGKLKRLVQLAGEEEDDVYPGNDNGFTGRRALAN
ncbi:MAG: helix-turn-helix domain-containing protein [Devosia sp.]|nr:helix-turn-helix domain-containing protein [Devosia sp.]